MHRHPVVDDAHAWLLPYVAAGIVTAAALLGAGAALAVVLVTRAYRRAPLAPFPSSTKES